MDRSSCPLCGTPGGSPLPRVPENLHYRRCANCEFVWLRNCSTPDDDIAQESQNDYYRRQQARVAEDLAALRPWTEAIIARAPGPVRAVAELGCTNGLVLRTFADRGLDVLGLERCPTTASFGIEMLRLPIVIGDIMGFTPRKRYDLIWMTHILEHMYDPIATLKRVSQMWCASPALIYIQIPALDLFLGNATVPPCGDVFCGGHASLFTETTLRLAFEKAGLHRAKIERYDIDEPARRLTLLDAYVTVGDPAKPL